MANVELPHVLRAVRIDALSLDIPLPLPPESIEVVDERASHERLDGSIDVLDVDALLERLLPVDGDELLRHPRQEGGVDGGELRTLAGCAEELVQIVGEELHVLARPILEHEVESAGRPHARDRRRREGERDSLRKTGELPAHALADELILPFPLLPVLPFLQGDEEE